MPSSGSRPLRPKSPRRRCALVPAHSTRRATIVPPLETLTACREGSRGLVGFVPSPNIPSCYTSLRDRPPPGSFSRAFEKKSLRRPLNEFLLTRANALLIFSPGQLFSRMTRAGVGFPGRNSSTQSFQRGKISEDATWDSFTDGVVL